MGAAAGAGTMAAPAKRRAGALGMVMPRAKRRGASAELPEAASAPVAEAASALEATACAPEVASAPKATAAAPEVRPAPKPKRIVQAAEPAEPAALGSGAFARGASVRLCGLQQKPALNGTVGIICRYDADADRWLVDLNFLQLWAPFRGVGCTA